MLKKAYKFILLVLLSAALVGCGADKKEQSDMESSQDEMATEQTKSNDPDNDEISSDSENPEDSSQGTEQSTTENLTETGAIVKVYFSNTDASGFTQENVKLTSSSPKELLKALIAKGAVSADVKLLSFTQSEKDGATVLDLDFSQELETYMSSLGTSGEYLTIGSICNTYLEAYGCEKVRITVEGASFATGHAEYPGYMGKFN